MNHFGGHFGGHFDHHFRRPRSGPGSGPGPGPGLGPGSGLGPGPGSGFWVPGLRNRSEMAVMFEAVMFAQPPPPPPIVTAVTRFPMIPARGPQTRFFDILCRFRNAIDATWGRRGYLGA